MNGSHAQSRRPFQGVAQIVKYNWPYYAVALSVVGVGIAAARWLPLPPLAACMLWLGLGLVVFWSFASIPISFYIYDFSPLYRWQWLGELLTTPPQAWVNIHVGLDETTEALRLLFPASKGRVLDIYDCGKMTERSVERARRSAGSAPSADSADFLALPILDSECDTAFLIFAAHEIRDPTGRLEFFKELRRILKPGGRLVLVEHLQDSWNFVAYGPGFLHFYSRAEWMRLADGVGLSAQSESSVTPFVRCLVFAKMTGA